MDIFDKGKVTFWTIIILIALNIASLAMLWFAPSRPQGGPGRPEPFGKPGERERFFRNELDLSPEQAQELEAVRQNYIQTSAKLKDAINQISQEYISELFRPELDSGRVQMYLDSLSELRDALEKINLNHFLELKEICGPDKYPLLERLMLEIMNMARPPHNPQQRPGPDLPPPDRLSH